MRKAVIVAVIVLIAGFSSFYIIDGFKEKENGTDTPHLQEPPRQSIASTDEALTKHQDAAGQSFQAAGSESLVFEGSDLKTPPVTGTPAPIIEGSDLETPPNAETPAPIIEGDWELIWMDDFDAKLDTDKWTAVERKHNYNNELQYYRRENVRVQSGCLYLTAKKQEVDGKQYTSGMIETNGKLTFQYGKIEARIKLPTGKGLLPAFWVIQEDGECEVDVVELVGHEETTVYGVNHFSARGRPKRTYGKAEVPSAGEYHIYTLEWEEDELRWYLDGALFHQTGRGVPGKPMYIIFTLAVGGNWPGRPAKSTVFPCSMIVDYIKLYRHI